jgi:magnesium transporter
VRALAMRELTPANAMRVLGKELLAGGFNGVLFMVTGLLLAVFWFGNPLLGALFGIAMLINLVFGAVAGVMIPLVMDRLGLDPAVVSGVFLTTVTDVVGFFAFLGLAALYLL